MGQLKIRTHKFNFLALEQSHPGGEPMPQAYNNYYDNGHSSRSLPSIHQHPQMIPNHPQPQYSSQQQMDYIQQLQNERMMIQEKNAQLMNSGLLDSPQPQFQAISPMGSNMMVRLRNSIPIFSCSCLAPSWTELHVSAAATSTLTSTATTTSWNEPDAQSVPYCETLFILFFMFFFSFQNQMNDSAMEVDYTMPPHPQHQHQQHPPQMHRHHSNIQPTYGLDVSCRRNSFQIEVLVYRTSIPENLTSIFKSAMPTREEKVPWFTTINNSNLSLLCLDYSNLWLVVSRILSIFY